MLVHNSQSMSLSNCVAIYSQMSSHRRKKECEEFSALTYPNYSGDDTDTTLKLSGLLPFFSLDPFEH